MARVLLVGFRPSFPLLDNVKRILIARKDEVVVVEGLDVERVRDSYQREGPHLVVLDLTFPKALELLAEIHRVNEEVCVIALASKDQTYLIGGAVILSGRRAMVMKPVREDSLLEARDRLLVG